MTDTAIPAAADTNEWFIPPYGQEAWRIAYYALRDTLPCCCDECRTAPGSDTAREAARLVRALRTARAL